MEESPHLTPGGEESCERPLQKKAWDTSFIEKDLQKEIADHEQRLAATHDELRTVVDSLTQYTEENTKLEDILFNLVNKMKKEMAFAARCKRKYSLLSGLLDKGSLSLVAAQDMISHCKNKTSFYLKTAERYLATLEDKSMYDNIIEERIGNYCYSFCKLRVSVQSKAQEETLASTASSGNSIDEEIRPRMNSNSSKYRDRERSLPTIVGEKVKGFRPRQASNWRMPGDQSDQPVFDLEVNDDAIFAEFPKEKLFTLGHTAASLRKDELAKVFSHFAFTDTTRKEFWRVRIGNKLRISRNLFENLQDRLNAEPLSKKSEKVIIDDLDRTFPICHDIEEGRSMYTNMKLILSLFEVYRPDIGYVQGMSYLLLVLYYYFDPFECFVLLANLIVTNRFMKAMYEFNMNKVYSYVRLFDLWMAEENPKLASFFEANSINTMTFSVDWYYTLYSRAFDIQFIRVVWDMFFLFGHEFPVRLGNSIITLLKDEMMTGYMSEGFNFLRCRTSKLRSKCILQMAFKPRYSRELVEEELQKFYELEEAKTQLRMQARVAKDSKVSNSSQRSMSVHK